MNSQYTIMGNRQDTYKSNHSVKDDDEPHKENIDEIMNIYAKRRKNKDMVANYPAIFHIITKKDMLSEAGLQDQINRAESLKGDLIDSYFFISSKDQDGIEEFLNALNDRRMELLKEEQAERDSLRPMAS